MTRAAATAIPRVAPSATGAKMSSDKDHSAIWRERLASRRAVHPGTAAVVGGASGARAHLSRGTPPRAGPSGADANPAPSDSPDDAPTGTGADLHPVPNDGNGREMCWRCRRVAKLCVCGLVREVIGPDQIPNRLGITVLQDRKEALKRPFGSAIVAELALTDCTSVWYDTKIPERVPRPPHLPDSGVGVLFPGPDARRLRRSPRTAIPGNGDGDGDGDGDESGDGDAPPTHLIVIDTTWHRARRMYGRIPWIRELPAYVLGEHTPLVRSGDASFDERGMKQNGNGNGDGNGDGDDIGDDIGDETGDESGDESGDDEPGDVSSRGGPRRESGYRIRKQPKPGFLSTAECIAAALREAEPAREDEADETAPGERAAAAVEACFDAMIDAQVRSFADRKNVRYRSRKAERAAKASAAEAGAGVEETVAVR